MNPNKQNDPQRPTNGSDDLDNLYRDLPLPNASAAKPVNHFPKENSLETAKNLAATNDAQRIDRSVPDRPLSSSQIETPRPANKKRFLWQKDIVGIGMFLIVVVVGALLINTFIFRSFNVIGPSMEPTLNGGVNGTVSDRLIINRVPITIANISGKQYQPDRGQIIVFRNPSWSAGEDDEYIVKRVIGLPGERVTVNNCELKVYNSEYPDGFDPYPDFKNLASDDSKINTCIDGDGTDVTVPEGEIFVVGDHRINGYSKDSRNGGDRSSLGTIPLDNIIGPVALRILPINLFKIF